MSAEDIKDEELEVEVSKRRPKLRQTPTPESRGATLKRLRQQRLARNRTARNRQSSKSE